MTTISENANSDAQLVIVTFYYTLHDDRVLYFIMYTNCFCILSLYTYIITWHARNSQNNLNSTVFKTRDFKMFKIAKCKRKMTLSKYLMSHKIRRIDKKIINASCRCQA